MLVLFKFKAFMQKKTIQGIRYNFDNIIGYNLPII